MIIPVKNTVLFLACVLAMAGCTASRGVKHAPAATRLLPGGLELVWSDEFDVDGPPDSSAWSHETGFSRNEELQWYQEGNATCRDGLLVITARRESRPNPWFRQGSGDWRRSRERVEYTSACIKTAGKKEFLHGRFEIRARIPTAPGAWPAIWTLGNSMPWPSCGEIDIMEYYRVRGVPRILANTAWGGDARGEARWDTVMIPFHDFTGKDPGWASKFHVWRMDWDEQAIRLYLDDELLNETLLAGTSNGAAGNHANPFLQPHYILLNLSIGGTNGGEPDTGAFPMVYEIDYVRVFREKGR